MGKNPGHTRDPELSAMRSWREKQEMSLVPCAYCGAKRHFSDKYCLQCGSSETKWETSNARDD